MTFGEPVSIPKLDQQKIEWRDAAGSLLGVV